MPKNTGGKKLTGFETPSKTDFSSDAGTKRLTDRMLNTKSGANMTGKNFTKILAINKDSTASLNKRNSR